MELNEIRDKVLEHEKSISNIDHWADNAEKRLVALEHAQSALVDIQLGLKELTMSHKFLNEKLLDMSRTLDKIDGANKSQHDAIVERLTTLEGASGRKWDKIVWLIVGAAVAAIVAILFDYLLK